MFGVKKDEDGIGSIYKKNQSNFWIVLGIDREMDLLIKVETILA